MLKNLLHLYAQVLLFLADIEMARCRRYDRRSNAALDRAQGWLAQARGVAEPLASMP
jgi:hypothetical protein